MRKLRAHRSLAETQCAHVTDHLSATTTMKIVPFALLLAAALCAGTNAEHSELVSVCMKRCRTLDGREWGAMRRSETPCAHELSAWPRPESYRACQDGHTSGAVLACQMGCHGIPCQEVSTRWTRVAATQDEVCGPWAGALPRPKMRYKCEEAFEHAFYPGCSRGQEMLAEMVRALQLLDLATLQPHVTRCGVCYSRKRLTGLAIQSRQTHQKYLSLQHQHRPPPQPPPLPQLLPQLPRRLPRQRPRQLPRQLPRQRPHLQLSLLAMLLMVTG